MQRTIYSIMLVLFSIGVLKAQTPVENLEKYWKYRDRLRKDFLKIGEEAGESIPMSARSIGFAYSGVAENANGHKPSRIYYQDATIYLGHYLAVLATEAKLLLNSYHATSDVTDQQALLAQLTATKNELYYAIEAVNRLDKKAEVYLSQSGGIPSPADLNGFFIRDDVREDFHELFQNDYSELFQRECDFIKTHSDFKPLSVWSVDGNGNPTVPGEQIEITTCNSGSNNNSCIQNNLTLTIINPQESDEDQS